MESPVSFYISNLKATVDISNEWYHVNNSTSVGNMAIGTLARSHRQTLRLTLT